MTAEPDEKQIEHLVAYLDGELDDAAAATVEQQLANDADVRRSVDKLSRTWELLELLPANKASQQFTERTLTAIRTGAVPADGEAVTVQLSPAERGRFRRALAVGWSGRALGILGLLIIASAAFRYGFQRSSQPVDDFLRDYPLVKRLGDYRDVGTIEFLQQLQASGVFNEQQQPKGDSAEPQRR